MRFKVGDKVVIKKDLPYEEVDNNPKYYAFVKGMEKYQKLPFCTISYISEDNQYYDLKEDVDDFAWTDRMLEPYKETINMTAIEVLDWLKKHRKSLGYFFGLDSLDEIIEGFSPQGIVTIIDRYEKDQLELDEKIDFLDRQVEDSDIKRWLKELQSLRKDWENDSKMQCYSMSL